MRPPARGVDHRTASSLRLLLALVAVLALVATACGEGGADDTAPASDNADGTAEDDGATDDGAEGSDTADAAAEGPLTVYSGRNEELVGPLFEQFTAATGIEVEVRYGDTAELAATIIEEGDRSPADVYFAQDAGALGALQEEGRLATLPDELLDPVDPRFRSGDGTWVGITGRSRTLVFDTETLDRDEVPGSVLDLTGDEWRGRVGWAPTNGSFQAFVTAMRVQLGDDVTREWLEGMVANDARVYENNTAIVEATGRGEVHLGLVNHYYLYRFLAEDPGFTADNAFIGGGDPGALVNVAGVGILTTTDRDATAQRLVEFLLSEDAQRYFADETFEYPLVTGIPADDRLPPLEDIDTPALDLSDLEDLRGTLEMLRTTGALM